MDKNTAYLINQRHFAKTAQWHVACLGTISHTQWHAAVCTCELYITSWQVNHEQLVAHIYCVLKRYARDMFKEYVKQQNSFKVELYSYNIYITLISYNNIYVSRVKSLESWKHSSFHQSTKVIFLTFHLSKCFFREICSLSDRPRATHENIVIPGFLCGATFTRNWVIVPYSLVWKQHFDSSEIKLEVIRPELFIFIVRTVRIMYNVVFYLLLQLGNKQILPAQSD